MSEPIHASPTTINALGVNIAGYREWLLGQVGSFADLKIEAGDFSEANQLETRVSDRANDLNIALTNIAAALQEIATNLQTNATIYNGAEENRVKAGEELDKLMENLNEDLPGLDTSSST